MNLQKSSNLEPEMSKNISEVISVPLQGVLEPHGLLISIEVVFENYVKQQSLFEATKYL